MHTELPGGPADLATQERHHELEGLGGADLFGESGVGWARNADRQPSRLEHSERFHGQVRGVDTARAVLRDDECPHVRTLSIATALVEDCEVKRFPEFGTSWSCLPKAATSRSSAGVTSAAKRLIQGHAPGEFKAALAQLATTTARGTYTRLRRRTSPRRHR